MPKSPTPKTVRAYEFHGVQLRKDSDSQYVGDCPLCDGERKFSVKITTGQYRCWRSGCIINNVNDEGKEGGNATTFVRQLHQLSLDRTQTKDYEELTDERGYTDYLTPVHWQLARSIITDKWMVPAYNVERRMTQLYVRGDTLYPTPFEEPRSGIFGANLYDPDCDTVWLCEGPWDGMALWEALGQYKRDGRGFARTASLESSLLNESSVLAIPGLGAVGKPLAGWSPLLAGRDVVLLFDNDHPKGELPSTSADAVLRAARILSSSDPAPESIQDLRWGPDGHDINRPHNYDIRDLLCQA